LSRKSLVLDYGCGPCNSPKQNKKLTPTQADYHLSHTLLDIIGIDKPSYAGY